MKIYQLVLAIGAVVLGLAACKKEQTTGERIKDKVDDALDRRPNEELRDAVEDAQKAAKDVVKEAKEAVKEATEGEKKK